MGYRNPEEALGELIKLQNGPGTQVSGVVEDYHHLSLMSELEPVVFFQEH